MRLNVSVFSYSLETNYDNLSAPRNHSHGLGYRRILRYLIIIEALKCRSTVRNRQLKKKDDIVLQEGAIRHEGGQQFSMVKVTSQPLSSGESSCSQASKLHGVSTSPLCSVQAYLRLKQSLGARAANRAPVANHVPALY